VKKKSGVLSFQSTLISSENADAKVVQIFALHYLRFVFP